MIFEHFGPMLQVVCAASLTLAALVAIAVAIGVAAPIDIWVFSRLRYRAPFRLDGKPKRLATAARDLTALGGDTLRLLFLVGCMTGLVCDDRLTVAAILLAIFAAARLALFGMKALVRRPRPPGDAETITTYTTSFPSGHTFMAGVLYLSSAMLIPEGQPLPLVHAAIGAALLLSFAIGLTRVSFGIHWPSDMVAGWLAAIAWTSGCLLLLQTWSVAG